MVFTKAEYRKRVKNAQGWLGELDALLVRDDHNLRYFTGVDSGRLLIWNGGAVFWLNEVYWGRAGDSYVEPSLYEDDCIKNLIYSQGFKKVGVDEVTLEQYNSYEPKLRKLIRTTDICENLRKIKSRAEINILSTAGRIAADGMATALDMDVVGMTELELAASIEYQIRKSGSEKPPFSEGMLCLSGPNTRYPHAPSGNRRIGEGDLLVLDLGAVYHGYHSDMTRTIEVGKVSDKQHEVASFIGELKKEAIDMVEVGGKISAVHKHISEKIEKFGYKFVHLSGHGVGLDIHERPSLGPDEKDVFQDSMVFAIEPGIYTGDFGARSEDTIALINGEKKVLTS